MALKILMLLKNNWELVGVFAVALTLLFYAYHAGAASERQKCDLEAAKVQEERQEQINNFQKLMDEKSQVFETYRAQSNAKMKDLQKRYENVKSQNSAFTSCHAGADFLQLYNEIGPSPAVR